MTKERKSFAAAEVFAGMAENGLAARFLKPKVESMYMHQNEVVTVLTVSS